MSIQASSSSNVHNPSEEVGHKEFPHGREEHSYQVEDIQPGGKTEQHFDKDTGQDTLHEAGDHIDHNFPAEVPLIYLFYWGILILVMVIILIYFVYRYKRHQSKPIIPLAVFLILFGLMIYILEIIAPTFSGKFDLSTLRIVHEFHESPSLGFMRFIYKFILGIFMAFFAFLNMDFTKFKSTKTKE